MRLLIIPFLILATVACKNDESEPDASSQGGSQQEMAQLRSKVRFLEADNLAKDSLITESMEFLNKIQENLARIDVKESEIRALSTNGRDMEISEDNRQWIMEQVDQINLIREENGMLMGRLQDLTNQNKHLLQANAALKEVIERQAREIMAKDAELERLRMELNDLSVEWSELYDAYQEQSELFLEAQRELNKAYYCYGSSAELTAAGVLEKKGVGRRKFGLADNLNVEYFTPIDRTTTDVINVEGDDIRLITDHPITSYTITISGGQSHLHITNHQEFWRVSKFLVIQVK